MRICILHSGENHTAFLNHLCNVCDACDYCSHCRPLSLNFSSKVYGIFHIPSNLPPFVENPQAYLPTLPECDLVIALEMHPDLLLELPYQLHRSKAKALIVPADASHWLQPGLRRQLEELAEDFHIEYAFPKPYCALDLCGEHPIINTFISRFQIGRPVITVELKGNVIRFARCVRSAPCGSTWYICEKLKNRPVDEMIEAVAGAHHSYPCNASMTHDPEIGDTLLHKAGYIVREAVLEALENRGVHLIDEVPIPVSNV